MFALETSRRLLPFSLNTESFLILREEEIFQKFLRNEFIALSFREDSDAG